MKYDYQISPHKKKKFIKKFYIFLIGIFVLGAILAGLIRLDTYLQSRKNTPEQTTTEKTTAYFASTTKIFRTQYFQFQAKNTWTEIPSESTETTFVYRSQRSNLIEEELQVYINEQPQDITATRVLPVKFEEDSKRLSPLTISDHCNEALGGFKANVDRRQVSYEHVKIDCDADNTQYNVLIGLVGGSTELTMKRPDGTEATYTVYYKNVKATPDAAELIDIIKSFQTR